MFGLTLTSAVDLHHAAIGAPVGVILLSESGWKSGWRLASEWGIFEDDLGDVARALEHVAELGRRQQLDPAVQTEVPVILPPAAPASLVVFSSFASGRRGCDLQSPFPG